MSVLSRTRIAGALASAWIGSIAIAHARQVELVSLDSSGVQGNGESFGTALSQDGRYVAFISFANNLVSGDTYGKSDLFVRDRTTGVTERVSVSSSGHQCNEGIDIASGSMPFAISADGQVVAFASPSTNLVSGDRNYRCDVFVRDRRTGVTERVSVDSSGIEGDKDSYAASISADGRFVAFESDATNLVSNDLNGAEDVFVRDRATGVTTLVSIDSSGHAADSSSFNPVISADGNVVTFCSVATNLVANDTNAFADVFCHDLATGATERISVSTAGTESDADSWQPATSSDGSVVAFMSRATNLVAYDTNQKWDAFVRDRTTGVTERVSVDSTGAEAAGWTLSVSISGDGRCVSFDNDAANLVPGDTNSSWDVFLHDRVGGRTLRISTDSSGAQTGGGRGPTISANSNVIGFSSDASDLVAGDVNGHWDVFVHDHCAFASWTNYGTGVAGTNGIPSLTSQGDPALGSTTTVDVANSLGQPTAGLLLLGFQRANVVTSLGGTLLVLPSLVTPITFSYGFDSFSAAIPNDVTLAGIVVDLQVVEADPGAVKGASFTPGIELVLGN
jgi:hypothetical protein